MDKVRCGEGWILMLRCPGASGALAADLDALEAQGATAVMTLLGDAELSRIGMRTLGREIEARGLTWVQAPVEDFQAPEAAFEDAYAAAAPALHARLAAGETVAVHCRAGLGRTGTVAARLLVEHGATADAAVAAVRAARPGTLETQGQLAHVRAAAEKSEGSEK